MLNKSLFSSNKMDWETPDDLMQYIYNRWNITEDIAPVNYTVDNLADNIRWKGRVYCNPPYGRYQKKWIDKCIFEFTSFDYLDLAVFLLPSRTDTKQFKMIFEYAEEIIFLIGRLKFKGANSLAPFQSMLVIFTRDSVRNKVNNPRISLLEVDNLPRRE